MDLIKDIWTKNDFTEYEMLLKENIDDKYKKFHENLCKTSKAKIIGVRLPIIRSFAKEIVKGDVESFVNGCPNKLYELIMTKGLVIAYLKRPICEKIDLIDLFVPLIDNWAICDTFCATIKPKEKELDYLFDYLMKYAFSDSEYEIRFATVLMMNTFITEKYIDRLYEVLDKTNCSYYYTSMAVAWSVSVCFAKLRDKTLAYMKNCKLDDITFNRVIQKCCDSYRVSKEDKAMLKSMKRK